MQCWICENNATTGEHQIKKSDLKLLYPNTTQQSPVYHRSNGERQKPIGSIKSSHFTFNALLCSNCNNTVTQDYDKAWEKLSSHLHKNWKSILKNNEIDLLAIFPNNINDYILLVQLYFVKLFGCKIEESKAPIDLTMFSKSILTKTEHPHLYISFRDSCLNTQSNYSALSNLELMKIGNHIVYAHLFYVIGNVTVDMIYSTNTNDVDLNGAQKPSEISNIFKLSKCTYLDALPSFTNNIFTNQQRK